VKETTPNSTATAPQHFGKLLTKQYGAAEDTKTASLATKESNADKSASEFESAASDDDPPVISILIN
jgi:hypothetical protein